MKHLKGECPKRRGKWLCHTCNFQMQRKCPDEMGLLAGWIHAIFGKAAKPDKDLEKVVENITFKKSNTVRDSKIVIEPKLERYALDAERDRVRASHETVDFVNASVNIRVRSRAEQRAAVERQRQHRLKQIRDEEDRRRRRRATYGDGLHENTIVYGNIVDNSPVFDQPNRHYFADPQGNPMSSGTTPASNDSTSKSDSGGSSDTTPSSSSDSSSSSSSSDSSSSSSSSDSSSSSSSSE